MKDFLLDHASINPVSFHMPGHKGREFFERYGYGHLIDRIPDIDVTEIPGADNLFQTEGIILGLMDRYARLYGAKKSYLLINGSSCGIMAAILACVKPGRKLIMARNCHKSVFNALTLGGIKPVYAMPEYIEDSGITGAISPEEIGRLLDENPDAEAVILPSPNYYGICSDIKAIADIVHQAGKVLIVDQAHGAHLKFFRSFCDGMERGEVGRMPYGAEDLGADIVIDSIHKTLASFTQSALMNVMSERVDLYDIEDRLQQLQSTSPSYVLMTFLDVNCEILENHGREAMSQWLENLEFFYGEAAKIEGLKIMRYEGLLDSTKINIDMSQLGINGGELEQLLMERGIFSELFTGNILMLMTGIGNSRDHFVRLLDALKEISQMRRALAVHSPDEEGEGHGCKEQDSLLPPAPGRLHKVPEKREFIALDEAPGRVCGASIIPYPPGIPLLCPGEEIRADAVEYIKAMRKRGEKVIGVGKDGKIAVGTE